MASTRPPPTAAAAAPIRKRDVKDTPFDLNSTKFDPDVYLNRALKEESLLDLIEHEGEMIQQIKTLDTEMQTLVYDNYNKFIVATDTICQMKNDFITMRDDMQKLDERVTRMCEASGEMNERLEPSRAVIRRYKCRQDVLKRFQFLFDLPAKLRQFIDANEYRNAVLSYSKAQVTLEKFSEHAAFAGIVTECKELMKCIRHKLYEIFHAPTSSAKQLAECVDLFNALNEPAENLWNEYLINAEQRLVEDLKLLERQVELLEREKTRQIIRSDSLNTSPLADEHTDILRFIEFSCNGFLNNIWLVIASYNDMFLCDHQTAAARRSSPQARQYLKAKTPSSDSSLSSASGMAVAAAAPTSAVDRETARIKLYEFTQKLMTRYFDCISVRVELEESLTSNRSVLVRAMDRLYRRLQAMRKLTDEIDFSRTALNIVKRAAAASCSASLHSLNRTFDDLLLKLRDLMNASSNVAVADSVSSAISGASATGNVISAVHMLETSLTQAIKHELTDLQTFIQVDVTFASIPSFGENFAKNDIVSSLIFQFFRHAAQKSIALIAGRMPVTARGSAGAGDATVHSSSFVSPTVYLVLSRLWLDISESILKYVLGLRQEMFPVDDDTGLPDVDVLQNELRDTAQHALMAFTRHQGSATSQMIRKSLETRDWLSATEPRNVRSAMKRVVETITEIDIQVGQVYDEGRRGVGGPYGGAGGTAMGSDSSYNRIAAAHHIRSRAKGLYGARQNAGGGAASHASMLSSNINRLFLDRIEIPKHADFSKLSVLTMVVKMMLKSLIESVRLRTFGKYGLQQLQVDAHYLELYLWRFVDDENVVRSLLDDVLNSAVQRCIEPELMEHNIVEMICEGNVR